ncbi:purine/pyrimidine permease [Alicyclobacillus ferrooxydans]|uniref:purine/pyrimidine permease n=1 Tax=Alicyclobacillus ferrooxydans TaxID=471514 RepID=UPI0006D52DD7|nr:purine/pyrimidine permease [Alicyclobacillus ferrooxydans]
MTTLTGTHQNRPRLSEMIFGTLQWFVFIVASVITVPIVLGPALGLSPHETALFIDRTLFVSGLIGLLQVTFGHRYPIVEGPAGMWWGVFLVLIQMTDDTGSSLSNLRPELELGLILAGVLYILLGALNWIEPIKRLFTPIVTGTFMVLLSLQLSESLIRGILGIGSGNGTVNGRIALASIFLVGLTVSLMMWGRGLFKNMAVLIALLAGWILYAVMGMVHLGPDPTKAPILLPQLLPFGMPKFSSGVVVTTLFTAMILLSNLITSVQAMSMATETEATPPRFRRGTFITGVGTVLAGLFGTVGNVPLATSASLVALTKMSARLPYIIASVIFALLGLIPSVGRLLVTLPAPVGYAVLFTVFGQLLGFGLHDFKRLALDQRDLFVISLSLLSGVGMFFVPSSAWIHMPNMVGYLVDNGLILGVALVLILEHVVFRRKAKAAVPSPQTGMVPEQATGSGAARSKGARSGSVELRPQTGQVRTAEVFHTQRVPESSEPVPPAKLQSDEE